MNELTYSKRRSLDAMGINLTGRSDRQQYLNEIKDLYELGFVSVDPDDPRTTIGFTDAEIKYIRSEK